MKTQEQTEPVTHTPGPWKWYWRETDGEADCSVISARYPGMAYCVARCPRYQKQEQWEADARLIAAAPELLRALNLAYKLLCTHADTIANTGEHPDNINNAIDLACEALTKAAIAKAEDRE